MNMGPPGCQTTKDPAGYSAKAVLLTGAAVETAHEKSMTKRLTSTFFKASAAVLGFVVLAGCATDPQKAVHLAKPKTLPVRNLTNFSEALRCMDQLFLQFDRSDMVITSAGIPDETNIIATGTKDMLISAISRMSRQSDAFTFVDYDATQTDVHDLQGLAGFSEDFIIPDFYIRGAITQLDDAVIDEAVSANAGYDADVGLSEDSEVRRRTGFINGGINAQAVQTVAVVSLDLNVGDLVTRQIISGISAHNSIAVSQNSVQGGLGGQFSKLGASFNIALSKGEGLHQAVRTLIELSTIEVLGKLAEVPFWQCLEVDHTDPAVLAEAQAWFEGMSATDQVAFVQQSLTDTGGFSGDVTGALDAGTRNAVARYQAQHDLIADGRINFDLYASLLNQGASSSAQPAGQPVTIRAVDLEEVEETEVLEAVATDEDLDVDTVQALAIPLELRLETTKGSDDAFEVNGELHFSASTNLDAHLYCYYADAIGNIARIFPNQFQPDSFLAADNAAVIPGENAGFDIILDQSGADERIACLASTEDVNSRLPAALKIPDLTPIPGQSLDGIIEAYRELDRDNIALARLDLRVR